MLNLKEQNLSKKNVCSKLEKITVNTSWIRSYYDVMAVEGEKN